MLIAYGFAPRCCRCGCCWRRGELSLDLPQDRHDHIAGIGMFIVWPDLKMPADLAASSTARGRLFAGSLLIPFLFITIACGAVSGFHALVSSGHDAQMIGDETQIPFIGYGAMHDGVLVTIMALCAASCWSPAAISR